LPLVAKSSCLLMSHKMKKWLSLDRIIRAKDVMSDDVTLVDISTSIKDAAKKMIDSKGNSIIVLEDSAPVGIVTYKDLVRKSITITNSANVPIQHIMSSPLIHSGPDQSIWEVVDLMYARDIKTIPIIDEYDKLLGIVNLMDVFKVLSLSRN